MLRKLNFLRGKSMSEQDRPAMDKVKERVRPLTLPPPEIPIAELTRLAIDLPKSHQDLLFKLVSKAPTEFHGFPKLPVAVRHKIIQMAFPDDRQIRLRVQYKNAHYNSADFGFPPPMTLYVNREFRAETEKHYYFFSQIHAFEGFSSVSPDPNCFCINPALDKITVGFQAVLNHDYTVFLQAIFNQIPECMEAIQLVEVLDFAQTGFMLQDSSKERVNHFMTANLAKFHHLDELRFILQQQETLDNEFVTAWKENVTKAFVAEKLKFPDCKIPTIICVSTQVRDAMRFLSPEHQT